MHGSTSYLMFNKKKLPIDLKWQEMRSKVIFDHLRSSKMAAGGHFVKKKFCVDLKWREMLSNVIFGHPIWAPVAIL